MDTTWRSSKSCTLADKGRTVQCPGYRYSSPCPALAGAMESCPADDGYSSDE